MKVDYRDTMGWSRESHPGHEGYVVALVVIEEKPASTLYRELRYPRDEAPCEVDTRLIQAACECGWRSPRMYAHDRVRWFPFSVELSERDEERIIDAWNHQHIEHTPPGEKVIA